VLDYPRASVGAKVIVTWQKYGAVASNGGSSLFGSDDDEATEKPAGRGAVRKVSRTQTQ
jgi:hypothetical protein